VRARSGELPGDGYVAGGPQLAVEVRSPSNTMSQLMLKAEEYLSAGTELVWIIDQLKECARVVSPAGTTVISRDGTLDGGTTLPGFTLKLSDLFDAE
jgi:Uma2 family endonuclease